jgi:3-hydroxyisobutyrate dehydrogenase-like beta-hydroxyacid dehydrogenase
VAAGADVRGYDPLGIAVEGVQARTSESAAVADADLVLSVNSSHDAVPGLDNALPGLRPGTVWADLNTAAPGVKAALATRAARRGVAVVALMSTVPGKGVRTPTLVAGEGAQRYAHVLTGVGAQMTVQEGPAGAAISRKLLRSVLLKGMAAAVVEALTAAEAAGCADWLHGDIGAGLAGFDESAVDVLVEGTHRHARRRADEMAAATEQLLELGVPARVPAAARDLLAELRDAGSAGPRISSRATVRWQLRHRPGAEAPRDGRRNRSRTRGVPVRKKLVVAAAAGALTLTGLAVAVPALADTDPADSRSASVVDRVRDALSGLVDDGSITREQADEVAGALSAAGFGGHGRHGGHGLEAVAQALGMTHDELHTALEADGATLAQVAQDRGIQVATLVDVLVAAGQERIAQAVADGRLTQEEADERLADLETRVTERVGSTREDHPRGGGRGGHD